MAKKRTRMVRSYPSHTLEQALALASAIQESNAGLPFDRVLLAKALGTTPASSGFTMKLNSSARYGLTQGGYNDDRIALTPRGESIVAPQRSGERRQALLEAALQPDLFRRFYDMLEGKRLPEDEYAKNVLQREMGVHASLTAECLRIIKANGLYVGILGEVGGLLYVSLSGAHAPEEQPDVAARPVPTVSSITPGHPAETADAQDSNKDSARRGGKIFIGHAGNPDIVDFLKTVMEPFGIPYSVVECDFDANQPIAPEVSQEMWSCNAAILIFATPFDDAWSGRREEKRMEKMLYQLGAASILYGERIVSFIEREFGSTGRVAGVHTLEFQRERPHEVGLELLTELHRMGVIEVRAHNPSRVAAVDASTA